MQATGYISSDISAKTTKTTGKTYFSFRLAENFGSGEKRTTTWYEVLAHVPEEVMERVTRGMLVTVSGKVEAQPYTNKNGQADASLRLIGFNVEPFSHPTA